jgi:parallel beta-helix repeat protein
MGMARTWGGTWGGRIVSAALVAALATSGSAAAKECGGDVACACGDAVRGKAVLAADLVGCAAGLRVKDEAQLDCAGHAIVGVGMNDGIVVEARRALVRDCFVSGFRTGIRVRGGGGNVLLGNEVVANGRYGIELAVQSSHNLLLGNLVLDSGDEGIHVGTGSNGNGIVGNQIADSGKENLYLLDATGSTVASNTISGGGSAAMYVKHSAGNLFLANHVADRPLQLRGASDANLFADNVVQGAGFVLQAYDDAKRGWLGPRGNLVRGGAVRDVKTCFRFEGAAHNRVQDGCEPVSERDAGGIDAVENVVDVRRE